MDVAGGAVVGAGVADYGVDEAGRLVGDGGLAGFRRVRGRGPGTRRNEPAARPPAPWKVSISKKLPNELFNLWWAPYFLSESSAVIPLSVMPS